MEIEEIPIVFAKGPKCKTLGWLEVADDEGIGLPIAACINLTAIAFFYGHEEKRITAIIHTLIHEQVHFIIRHEIIDYYLEGEEEAVEKFVGYVIPLPFTDRIEYEEEISEEFEVAYALKLLNEFRWC